MLDEGQKSTRQLDFEKLQKENKQLKAICSIIRTSIISDCRYNTELLARLIKMNETSFGGYHEILNWRLDSNFQVLDSAGEHDPVYLVSPNGEMFELNHYADHTTDLARAQFMAEALNKQWQAAKNQHYLKETQKDSTI